ncbi:anti-sigma factor family protein [Krasilnikovia sp. MM14-A1004]|uniref:anti-sigma factor family protein n=1 Tax=Krasilnikovia sp. MM14-A1004 TaxID=3373541 RepID=UPI00399D35F7
MTTEHVTTLLGAYVLGALDEQEVTAVDEHIASCPECRLEAADLRGVETALGELPPEALIDGPPADGELLLQRTLRTVRKERGRQDWRRRATVAAAAVAVGGAVLGGGTVLGRATAPQTGALPPPVTTPVTAPATMAGSAQDPTSGARMSVAVRPAAGWVRVNATVSGITPGQRCRLLVVAHDGSRREAGSWLASATSASTGTNLDGFALVPPSDVAAVAVETFEGTKLVSVPV